MFGLFKLPRKETKPGKISDQVTDKRLRNMLARIEADLTRENAPANTNAKPKDTQAVEDNSRADNQIVRETTGADRAATLLRKPPANDNQPDFFVPKLWDIAIKDGIGLMDVAVFRLSRSNKRKGDLMEHKVRNLTIQIKSNYDGMATIDDYSIVMMMISHLTEANRLYQEGRGPKPPRHFQPAASEILKFCRKADGGEQYELLRGAINRLQGTQISIDCETERRRTGWFPLLAGAEIVSETNKKRIQVVRLEIPNWIYNQIVTAEKPEVLTIHPDYFLISSPLARFIYRLARKAAGAESASYSFASIHSRSGSTRALRKFEADLRRLIAINDLPEYDLAEEHGRDGKPLLRMTRRYLH